MPKPNMNRWSPELKKAYADSLKQGVEIVEKKEEEKKVKEEKSIKKIKGEK